jgi:hypothetical protein
VHWCAATELHELCDRRRPIHLKPEALRPLSPKSRVVACLAGLPILVEHEARAVYRASVTLVREAQFRLCRLQLHESVEEPGPKKAILALSELAALAECPSKSSGSCIKAPDFLRSVCEACTSGIFGGDNLKPVVVTQLSGSSVPGPEALAYNDHGTVLVA